MLLGRLGAHAGRNPVAPFVGSFVGNTIRAMVWLELAVSVDDGVFL